MSDHRRELETWNRPEPSGERQGRREGIERMTGQLVSNGMSQEQASKRARQCAIRKDRREESKKR